MRLQADVISNPDSANNLPSQIAAIREQIQKHGHAVVGCEELVLLCDGEVEPARQLIVIARIASWEGWSYTTLGNGSVRFAKR